MTLEEARGNRGNRGSTFGQEKHGRERWMVDIGQAVAGAVGNGQLAVGRRQEAVDREAWTVGCRLWVRG